MRSINVHISELAFLSLTLSSVEAYKKECYGLLLGYRSDTQWRVEYAVPYQTADRGHNRVVPHGLRDRRVRTCVAHLSSFEQLGTYHSHPAWGNCRALAKPSVPDVESVAPGELEMIIAVNDARRPQRFHNSDHGRILTGTVCDFSLTMATFYKPPLGDQRMKRLPIRCPYALGFQPDFMLK